MAFQESPQFQIETKLGAIHITITERGHIYVRTEESESGLLKVNGSEWPLILHLYDFGDGKFAPGPDYRDLYMHRWNSAKGRFEDASPAARKKILEVIVPAINDWLLLRSHLLDEAQAAHVNNRVVALENDISELEAKIAEKRAEIEKVRSTINPVRYYEVAAEQRKRK